MNKVLKKDINVLVVDDVTGSRKIVIKKLKELGYSNFQEAQDGAAAWELINGGTANIDLILSDINMPKMTGVELLKLVRASEKLKDVPFIIISAEVEKRMIFEAIKEGVSSYLVKPIDEAELKEKLCNITRLLESPGT